MTLESKAVRNDVSVAEVLDYSDAARTTVVIKLYERTDGHGEVWGQRVAQYGSSGSSGSSFEPTFVATKYEPPRTLSPAEVDAAIVLRRKLAPSKRLRAYDSRCVVQAMSPSMLDREFKTTRTHATDE